MLYSWVRAPEGRGRKLKFTCWCRQPDGLQQLLQLLLRDQRAIMAVDAKAIVDPQPGRQCGRHQVPPVGAPLYADAIVHPVVHRDHWYPSCVERPSCDHLPESRCHLPDAPHGPDMQTGGP